VRLSVVLLLLALAGVLGGGALIGLPALGGCLIFDSLCVGLWALERDDGTGPAQRAQQAGTTLAHIFERARAS
jgi:hypothetical protein